MVPSYAVIDPRHFAPQRAWTNMDVDGCDWLIEEIKSKGCAVVDDRGLIERSLKAFIRACYDAPPPVDAQKIKLAEELAHLLNGSAMHRIEVDVPEAVSDLPAALFELANQWFVDSAFIADTPPESSKRFPIARSFRSPLKFAEPRLRVDPKLDEIADAAKDLRVKDMIGRLLFRSSFLRVVDPHAFKVNEVTKQPYRWKGAMREVLKLWERPVKDAPVRLELFTALPAKANPEHLSTLVNERLETCCQSIAEVLRELKWSRVSIRVRVVPHNEALHDRFLIADRGGLEISAGFDRLAASKWDGFSLNFDRSLRMRTKVLETSGVERTWKIHE